MDTSDPIARLHREHQLILRVLETLRRAVKRLEAGGRVPPAFWEEVVNFLQNFADHFHHAKEEELLFGLLQEHHRDSVAALLEEHEQGRLLVHALETATALTGGDNTRELAATAREYAGMLETHIRHEDEVVYPRAERKLTPEGREALSRSFDQREAQLGRAQTWERYQTLADSLVAMIDDGRP